MTEHAPDRIWSGIQISKIVAGTLAAVSAAVIGSFLGVAGTLAGAAIASIVGSVGTEIYQRSLDRGAKKLQTLAPTFVKAPAAVGTPEVAAAAEEDSPSHTVPEEVKQSPSEAGGPQPPPERQIRWGRVAIAAGLLFVFAMIPLTFVEIASGRTIANLVGSSQATGTTVGTAVTGNEQKAPATAPSEEQSQEPTDEESTAPSTDEETTEPTEAPTSTEPTAEPTSTTPATEAPTTQEPEQEPADPQPNEQFGGNRPQEPQQGTE